MTIPATYLPLASREEFREWLAANHARETECWLAVKRGVPKDESDVEAAERTFWYLDALEEALCFGWIDSTLRRFDGVGALQRFGPRTARSHWTELNKERARRLERLGVMTEAGRRVLPNMDPEAFRVAPEVRQALEEAGAWDRFCGFPPLYQRIRASNVAFYRTRDAAAYERALSKLVERTAKGEMYGQWNDGGRLLES